MGGSASCRVRSVPAPLDSIRSRCARSLLVQLPAAPASADAVYFVSAMYDGIAYFTPPLPEGKVSGEEGEIAVFDTTSAHVPISAPGHHVVVSAVDANARRTVMEVYDLSNDSSVTRVAAGDKPEQATFQARLTPGATDFRVTQGDVSAAAVTYANGVVSVFAPIAPGVKQLSFTLHASRQGISAELPLEKETRRLRGTGRGEDGKRDWRAAQGSRSGDGGRARLSPISRRRICPRTPWR